MPEQSCRHCVGPVEVEHRPGLVWAWCAACDDVISAWLGDECNDYEVVELRGVAEDVKDHLDRSHRDVERHEAEVLRACAWDSLTTGSMRAAPRSEARLRAAEASIRVNR